MRLGTHSTSLLAHPFEDGLRVAAAAGIESVEVACAGVFKDLSYGDPSKLVDDASAREAWLDAFDRHGLSICALSIHGDPLSPDPVVAERYSREFRQACRFAELIGVERLTLLTGLPEGAPGDRSPHWVVDLPREFTPAQPEIVEWQWEERVLPYWREHAKVAADHGCRLCFEMCAWDVVYNPRTLMRLRDAIGPTVGCNFDPSHLLYQGIDVCASALALGDSIYLVHAKDTRFMAHNVRVNGWLDVNPAMDVTERAWTFATVGYGHDELFWRQFITTLRLVGYDDVLSIEHEDDLVGLDEGLSKAATFLRPLLLEDPPLHPIGDVPAEDGSGDGASVALSGWTDES